MTDVIPKSDPNMYWGCHDESQKDAFKKLITGLLVQGNLKEKYITLLTNEKSMEEYKNAFTAASYQHPEKNYERYEQFGDKAAGHFIISYMHRRFPQLDCTAGVKVVSRLLINYGSKASFSEIAYNLGFWPFITCPNVCPPVDKEKKKKDKEYNKKCRELHKNDLLEDVFEAFIGCTEVLLDNYFRYGVGYAIVYDILASIFEKIEMSLEYEDLMDAKTRLKETFDLPEVNQELGTLLYVNTGGTCGATSSTHIDHLCQIFRVPPGVTTDVPKDTKGRIVIEYPWYKGERVNKYYNNQWVFIASHSAPSKSASEQNAAEKAIKILKDGIMYNQDVTKTIRHEVKEGEIRSYYKYPPPEYQFFCRK